MDFVRNIWRYYTSHLEYIMLPFQSVIEDNLVLERIWKRKYRFHSLIPLCMTLGFVIDTAYMFSIYGYDTKDVHFFHHIILMMMPEFFLEQGDVGHFGVYILFLFCHYSQFLDHFPHINYVFLLSEGSDRTMSRLSLPYRKDPWKMIDTGLERMLVKYYRRYKAQIKAFIPFTIFQLNCAYTFPLLGDMVYRMYKSGWETYPSTRVIIAAIICPFYMRYIICAIHMGIQFMCQNVNVLQVKQKYYLSELRINENFAKNGKNFLKAYLKWRQIMSRILDLTVETHHFNAFYSKYISITYISYVIIGCAILNGVLNKIAESPILPAMSWITFGTLFLGFTAFISAASSRTIYFNLLLFKALRKLQTNLLSSRHLNRSKVIKLDLVNEYKMLLLKSSFKLLNSMTINNKLFFFQIFSAVSFFYLKLVSRGKSW